MDTRHRLPAHGEVASIGGHEMTSNIKQRFVDTMMSSGECERIVKTLPDEALYDDTGLPIWNDIIFTDEFYQTHDEIAIFEKHGVDVVNEVHRAIEACKTTRPITIMDLGAGDTRKVQHLLSAFETAKVPANYYALDISKKSLDDNVKYLADKHSNHDSVVTCAGLWGTFEDGLEWAKKIKGPRLFLSLGSVLCNDSWLTALAKVKDWAGILKSDDVLLVGMDGHLIPDHEEKIWAAYHSRDDLYKNFFQNGFNHLNRLVGEAWLSWEHWDLKAELQEEKPATRHRFYLCAKHDFQIRHGGTVRVIKKGEQLDWFDSHKYAQSNVELMFDKSDLEAISIWQTPDSEFRE
jgi:EasF-like predicted methyltransferase